MHARVFAHTGLHACMEVRVGDEASVSDDGAGTHTHYIIPSNLSTPIPHSGLRDQDYTYTFISPFHLT